MITILLVFSILILFALSVYLFSKAEEESQWRKQKVANSALEHEAVVISTIQQGKVQETWCYINDLRSRLKHANVTVKDAPTTLEHIFKA
jgi:hypothetical protein